VSALPASMIEMSKLLGPLPRINLPYRAPLWAVQSATSEACISYPTLELFRFHIRFFGWFSALFVPVYLLTSTARYDIPGRQVSCRAPVSPPKLTAFELGQNPSPPLGPIKLYAKQCDFCDAATLASSASLRTWLATIQPPPMRYLPTHRERIRRRSPSKT
jgi:hypothetical protein